MNKKQLEYLTEKYILSQCAELNVDEQDIEEWNGDEDLELYDEREEIEKEERKNPGSLFARIQRAVLTAFIFDMQKTLNDYHKSKNYKKPNLIYNEFIELE